MNRLPRRAHGGRSGARARLEGREGFAAVDALVALLILSATLVLSLNGLQSAARLGRIAEETGQATALARQIMVRRGDGVSDYAGRSGQLAWSLEAGQLSGQGGDDVCTRTLLIRGLASGRSYRFATATPCS